MQEGSAGNDLRTSQGIQSYEQPITVSHSYNPGLPIASMSYQSVPMTTLPTNPYSQVPVQSYGAPINQYYSTMYSQPMGQYYDPMNGAANDYNQGQDPSNGIYMPAEGMEPLVDGEYYDRPRANNLSHSSSRESFNSQENGNRYHHKSDRGRGNRGARSYEYRGGNGRGRGGSYRGKNRGSFNTSNNGRETNGNRSNLLAKAAASMSIQDQVEDERTSNSNRNQDNYNRGGNSRQYSRGYNQFQQESNGHNRQNRNNRIYDNRNNGGRGYNYRNNSSGGQGSQSQYYEGNQGNHPGLNRGRGNRGREYRGNRKNQYHEDQYYVEDYNYSYNGYNNNEYQQSEEYKQNSSYNSGNKSSKQKKGRTNHFGENKTLAETSAKSEPAQPKKNGKMAVAHEPTPVDDDRSQRDRLIDLLTTGTYECMVCCDRIKQSHAIWSCPNCYNCFHIGCVKKWASTSQEGKGWRCPACQHLTPKVPNCYKCFCGKMREPDWNRRDTPHSCGEVCGSRRGVEWCTHKCNVLCHPGPCPECMAYIKRSCSCGAETRDVRCSKVEPFQCESVCGKLLNCGLHTCPAKCHVGNCEPCEELVEQECHCGKKNRSLVCDVDTVGVTSFSCEDVCDKKLDCGNHACDDICHPGDCRSCERLPSTVKTCPCGKTPLEDLYKQDNIQPRQRCLDPIPTCHKTCSLKLKCGTPGNFHECQVECHEGPCPVCPLETSVKCRCGAMDQDLPCSQLDTKADEITCKKLCKKIRQCGRHKCNTKCCIDIDHICTLQCGKLLSCRLHKCEEPCHRGNCPRCLESSFDELTCHCGAEVTYPPVPCGTRPPICERPCSRPRNCVHPAGPVGHYCHPDDESCPPCTMLVKKLCFGGHKTMSSTPCYVTAISCGDPCNADLPCGIHKCKRACHEDPCIPGGSFCSQKCSKPRMSCGHPCANPCHAGPCPDAACKEMVKISCECGHRSCLLPCAENDREYRAMATSLLATQMHHMNTGSSIDISGYLTATAKPEKLKRLECNEDCSQVDRNRRLALALQIGNPDTKEKLGNTNTLFSDFIKDEARKDSNFANMVHNALTELVIKAKQSKQKSRSHSFAPMNREKRQFIHEYCKNFGCQSESYDEEPKKNVVATAVRGLCFLPPTSVVTQVQREKGQKKVPGPVWGKKTQSESISCGMKKLEKRSSVEKEMENSSGASGSGNTSTTGSGKPIIDYFNYEGSL